MQYWSKILKETLCKRLEQSSCSSSLTNANSRHDASSSFPKKPSKLTPPKSYFLGEDFPGIYLTQREAECMVSFLKNKTVSEAAAVLDLSPRTVEFYLKNMKVKLECKTKSELIHKVRESDFSKNYLQMFNCENKD